MRFPQKILLVLQPLLYEVNESMMQFLFHSLVILLLQLVSHYDLINRLLGTHDPWILPQIVFVEALYVLLDVVVGALHEDQFFAHALEEADIYEEGGFHVEDDLPLGEYFVVRTVL